MSTTNHAAIASRLTADRLGSYQAATGGDVATALDLYDWNIQVGGALHEDIGRLEVVFRNALDRSLVSHGTAAGWPVVWYRRAQLFQGKHGGRALADIRMARRRAMHGSAEVHGKVTAELSLGFWRYLCTTAYLTSLWVPALGNAFPNHPSPGDPRTVRKDVEDRIQRVHFLRNRIAHHEPIHQRNLPRDVASITELAGWICGDTRDWIVGASRWAEVDRRRP